MIAFSVWEMNWVCLGPEMAIPLADSDTSLLEERVTLPAVLPQLHLGVPHMDLGGPKFL
jgi:hypothetical protein